MIKRARDDKIFARMELCTHDKISMTSHDSELISAEVVPNSDSLIIGSTENPRKLESVRKIFKKRIERVLRDGRRQF